MSADHTPLPWDVDGTYLMGRSEDGRLMTIADCARSLQSSIPLGKANAAFIGLAVNSHDELVAALRGMVREYVKRGGAFDEPLGASEQSPEVNAAIEALSRIPDIQIKGAA